MLDYKQNGVDSSVPTPPAKYNKNPGHNEVNNHNKTLKAEKKRVDRLETSGLEEQDSTGFPGFSF